MPVRGPNLKAAAGVRASGRAPARARAGARAAVRACGQASGHARVGARKRARACRCVRAAAR